MTAQKTFLDTSALWGLFAGGHSRQREELERLPTPHYVCNYALVEFYRAVVLTYLELFIESELDFHRSFADACQFFKHSFGRTPKTIVDALLRLMQEEDFSLNLSLPEDKELCRQMVLTVVSTLVEDLDDRLRLVGENNEHCSKLRKRLKTPVDEVGAGEFCETFTDHKECRRRCSIDRFLNSPKFQESFDCVSQTASNKQQKTLAANLEKVREHPEATTCRKCGSIGDIIITASAPDGFTIHTYDRAFGLLSQCFEKPSQYLESLASMKKDWNPED